MLHEPYQLPYARTCFTWLVPGLASAVLTFACHADASLRPVWTPNQNKGKPYPVKKVPIEVWAIGSFKFKGIPGVSKVRLTNAVQFAGGICTACSELLMGWIRMIAPTLPLSSAHG